MSDDKMADALLDDITSKIYRQFKEWSQRGFTEEDVTWCEVRAWLAAAIAATGGKREQEGRAGPVAASPDANRTVEQLDGSVATFGASPSLPVEPDALRTALAELHEAVCAYVNDDGDYTRPKWPRLRDANAAAVAILAVPSAVERQGDAQDARRWRAFKEMDLSDTLVMIAGGTDHYDAKVDAAISATKEKP